VGVNEPGPEQPSAVLPNPFSDNIIFRYTISEATFVKIILLNSLGQVIAEPLNKLQQPGQFELTWNSNCLPSGLYYYKLIIENKSSSGKMVKL
jgi:hypothetical protein